MKYTGYGTYLGLAACPSTRKICDGVQWNPIPAALPGERHCWLGILTMLFEILNERRQGQAFVHDNGNSNSKVIIVNID